MQQFDEYQEFAFKWLEERNIRIQRSDRNKEAVISVKIIEMLEITEFYKEHPRNRFQTCHNFTVILNHLENRGCDIDKLNPYKLACGNYEEMIKFFWLLSHKIYETQWKSYQFNDWKAEKMRKYNIQHLVSASLNRQLETPETTQKQNTTIVVCQCGQLLLGRECIRGDEWTCTRCSLRNKLPPGFQLKTYDDVSLGGEVGANEGSLDIVFVVDTTGSMGSYIDAAKEGIKNIVSRLFEQLHMTIRFALIEYRDHPPQDQSFANRLSNFTSNVNQMKGYVDQMSATGGGDGPESIACAFHCANTLSYADDATKIVIWIADAPPHGYVSSGDGFPGGCPCGYDFIQEVDAMTRNGITIYPVICSTDDRELCELMRATAQRTNGLFLGLDNTSLISQAIISVIGDQVEYDRTINRICDSVDTLLRGGERNKTNAIQNAVDQFSRTNTIKKATIVYSSPPERISDIFLTATHLSQLKSYISSSSYRAVTYKSALRVDYELKYPDAHDKQRLIKSIKSLYDV